jgi:NTP pyrophosphatase (non-canonical NTP hydrolase)
MSIRKDMLGKTMAGLQPYEMTLDAVSEEVRRARKKFPGRAKLLAALIEEVGELAKAMLQRKSLEDVEKEAVQIACVAIRIIEEGDSDFDAGEWGDAP